MDGRSLARRLDDDVASLERSLDRLDLLVGAPRIVVEQQHAGDARARVVVSYGARGIAIEVSDDGRGGTPNGGGHGLTGLRERVAVFGGELEAGSREGGGFTLRAWLPLEQATR